MHPATVLSSSWAGIEHDHVRFAPRAPLLLPVEERHDCRDEEVERRDGKHRTWHNEQEVEGAHG